MKKILITGNNGYIGKSFIDYAKNNYPNYEIDTINLRDSKWINSNFSNYEIVLHLAGIAHVSRKKEDKEIYYKINRDLTLSIAEKAKNEGVKRFIFMSSIIVYGSKNKLIHAETVENPDDFYGDSKLQAEKLLQKIENNNFRISIIRSPMVYGPGSKGNFNKLVKLAKITPIFPNFANKRSMIYIYNLNQVIAGVINEEIGGIIYPQNNEYSSTTEIVKIINDKTSRKVFFTKFFNPFIKILLPFKTINKLFGDLYYSEELINVKRFVSVEFEKSIEESIW